MQSDAWTVPLDALLTQLDTTASGLSSAQAAHRQPREPPRRLGLPAWWPLLQRQFTSPMVLVLVAATAISMLLGNLVDGVIILTMVVASGLLGFVQERRAGHVMEGLLARVRVHADALRDGREVEVLPSQLVPGDVVLLRAGDIVPADLRLLESTQLLVDESPITGEPEAVEKSVAGGVDADGLPANGVFYGSHVVSGRAVAVVVTSGSASRFGSLLQHLAVADVETRFEREMTAFGLMLTRLMAVLVACVLVANLLLHRPLIDSLLFALALGVGMTPEMLPAIVVVSLSIGARRMAAKSVLVKRLDAIEDVGAMTILCCDKTGTLTRGVVELDAALDVNGSPSERVLRLAGLNAGLQQGYPNPIDIAISRRSPRPPQVRLVAESPYDFERRRLSVLTSEGELICKGAFASVLACCTQARSADGLVPVATVTDEVHEQFESLSTKGFRVLAIATKPMLTSDRIGPNDESGLVLEGLLALMDPVTDTARAAIDHLRAIGVDLALITGDNAAVATAVAASAGMDVRRVLTGADLDAMDDAALTEATRQVRIYAAVDPLQKERIVLALRRLDHTVGFLGDGINDAAALRVADAGISVDTGTDVAKQAAALVILDKNLDVIADGIALGRRTFANTVKYVRITISANFGNMLSLVVASLVLPFIPMLPAQILLLNLLSDGPALAIATDRVDPEEERAPRTWDLHSIRRFMLLFGLVSSVFDLLGFLILRHYLHADATLFRSAWFLLSLFTELIALLALRTQRPALRSRPSRTLAGASIAMVLVGLGLALSGLAPVLGMQVLPADVLAVVGALSLAYWLANEAAKGVLRHRRRRLRPS